MMYFIVIICCEKGQIFDDFGDVVGIMLKSYVSMIEWGLCQVLVEIVLVIESWLDGRIFVCMLNDNIVLIEWVWGLDGVYVGVDIDIVFFLLFGKNI